MKIISFCGFLLLNWSVFAAQIPSYNMQRYDSFVNNIYQTVPATHNPNIATRVAAISKLFLGQPYLLEPLGEGSNGMFDQGPLYRSDAFDCVTFVNTVLALAESNNLAQFKSNIIKIRYHNSKISYNNRTHWFIQVDWNPVTHHNGFLQDITYIIVDKKGRKVAKIARTIINKPGWYKRKKLTDIKLLQNVSPKSSQKLLQKLQHYPSGKTRSTMLYLPLTKLFTNGKPNKYIFAQIPSGSVIEIVRPNWPIKDWYGTNLNVSHLGLAVREDGQLIFRNASSLTHKVMDIPLTKYLQKYLKSSTIKGINVQQIIPAYHQPTLQQEIARMLIVGFDGFKLTKHSPIVKDIKKYHVGGVALFDYNFRTKKYAKNIKSPTQLRQLTAQLRHYATYPLIISVDYEGGAVNRLKEKYGFPKTYSAAELAKLPTAVIAAEAAKMAQTLRQAGINLDFAPVLDLNVNPNNPVIGKLGRSFSAFPLIVTKDAAIFAKALKKYHIMCAYKHFPGHGSSSSDSHKDFVDVSKTWSPLELKPYQQLITQPFSCNFIMTAHIVNRQLDPSGLPATLSSKILNDLLRHKLHFRGIIVSDDMQMKAITKYYGLKQALKLGLNTGVDMFIFGNQLQYDPNIVQKVVTIVARLVQTGQVPRAKIDNAYARIKMLA